MKPAIRPLNTPKKDKPDWKIVPKEANRTCFKGGESCKIRWDVIEYLYGTGLDLGCGAFKVTKNAIGVDRAQLWMNLPVQANIVGDVKTLPLWATGKQDFVFSSHVLEDFEDYASVLREWWRVVKKTGHELDGLGGYLVLYLPLKGLIAPRDAPLEQGGNPEHKHDGFAPEEITAVMKTLGGWDLVRDEIRDQGDEYSFLQVYRKRKDKQQHYPCRAPTPKKRVAVIRYGGVGDHIITSTILRPLKAEGWHITYVTNPAGRHYMEHHPHIDEWICDTAALTNEELLEFWHALEGRFDRVINMMNSVENVTLAQPGSPMYHMPDHLRREYYAGHNYNEMTFAWAGVAANPEKIDQQYYESKEDGEWAEKELRKYNDKTVVLWALAGSAVHKVSPVTPQAVKMVLDDCSAAVVILTGGEKEKKLLGDFLSHPRLRTDLVGNVTIGRTLALAKRVAIVCGPETGVLNAVALFDKPAKAVWLSHSSEYNLCKYWKNYVAVKPDPEVAPCAPCYRLHWSFDNCRTGSMEGAALCVQAIPARRMADAVLSFCGTAQEAVNE